MRRPNDTVPPAQEAIRNALEARGMTIKDLAAGCGYTNLPYIYGILSGALGLTRDQIACFAATLDLDPDDLHVLNGSMDPDLEARLKSDRVFLRAVRNLTTGDRPQNGQASGNEGVSSQNAEASGVLLTPGHSRHSDASVSDAFVVVTVDPSGAHTTVFTTADEAEAQRAFTRFLEHHAGNAGWAVELIASQPVTIARKVMAP